MTRAELIRKIAKQNGVPDYEAKYFFETFLQKVSSALSSDQALKVDSFGYFQKRRAVIEASSNDKLSPVLSGSGGLQNDVILFSSEDGSSASLIFNLPAGADKKINTADSLFSLSIGKPVIPLEGVKSNDILYLPTGIELKKLVESKAEKLFEGSEIVSRKISDGDILVIKKSFHSELDSSEDQFMVDLTGESSDTAIRSSGIDSSKTSEFEHVAWDFGEDLSKQIEEESILDVSGEVNLIPTEESGWNSISAEEGTGEINWDFGKQENESEVPEPSGNSSDEINPQEAGEDIEEENEQGLENYLNEETVQESSAGQTDEFERVKSITSEFGQEESSFGLTKSELNLSWDFNKRELTSELEEEVPDPENDTVNLQPGWSSNIKDTIVTEETDKVQLNEEPESSSGSKSSKRETGGNKLKEFSYNKNRSPFVFFIAMVTILTVGGVMAFYFTGNSFVKLTNQLFGGKKETAKQIKAEVINRSFQVPVTYPYLKKNSSSTTGSEIDPGVFKASRAPASNQAQVSNLSSLLSGSHEKLNVTKENKAQALPGTSKEVAKPASSQKIKDNIYLSGGNYSVQVSSWKSKSIAESQVAKYKKKGFDSYIEAAQVPGRGTWYRVKVGDFKTVAEAESFIKEKK